MEISARVSRDTVTLTAIPKGVLKPGFLKRLPTALSKRPRKFVEKFLGYNEGELDSGTHKFQIELSRNGGYIVSEITFGDRRTKRHPDATDQVVTKTKVLVNRKNGLGIRLCFLDDSFVGRRVDIY